MKLTIGCIFLALALAGCRSANDDFNKMKSYAEITPPGAFDPHLFIQLFQPICERKKSISFLDMKAKGSDPKDTILACALLATMMDQVYRYPTPQGHDFVREIRLSGLSEQMDCIVTQSLTSTWASWHAMTREMINDLSPISGPDSDRPK